RPRTRRRDRPRLVDRSGQRRTLGARESRRPGVQCRSGRRRLRLAVSPEPLGPLRPQLPLPAVRLLAAALARVLWRRLRPVGLVERPCRQPAEPAGADARRLLSLHGTVPTSSSAAASRKARRNSLPVSVTGSAARISTRSGTL